MSFEIRDPLKLAQLALTWADKANRAHVSNQPSAAERFLATVAESRSAGGVLPLDRAIQYAGVAYSQLNLRESYLPGSTYQPPVGHDAVRATEALQASLKLASPDLDRALVALLQWQNGSDARVAALTQLGHDLADIADRRAGAAPWKPTRRSRPSSGAVIDASKLDAGRRTRLATILGVAALDDRLRAGSRKGGHRR